MAGDTAQSSANSANYAGGHGRFEAKRAADSYDELADAQLSRVTEGSTGEARRFGLDDGQIGPRVGADRPAGILPAIVQPYADAFLAADDMVVRQQEAVLGE